MEILQLNKAGGYWSNCYLLTDHGHSVVVDPGVSAEAVQSAVMAAGSTLDAILLTHGHFDHIRAVDTLRAAYPGVKVYIHSEDAPMLVDGEKNAYAFFFDEDKRYAPAEERLTDGQTLTVGEATLTVLHTPGHSPGSVCFLDTADSLLITGDTLFDSNVGRWDLWRGDKQTLMYSLDRLEQLDPNLTIYPGHGDTGRLGTSLRYARYLF